jgi:hypothetical protein
MYRYTVEYSTIYKDYQVIDSVYVQYGWTTWQNGQTVRTLNERFAQSPTANRVRVVVNRNRRWLTSQHILPGTLYYHKNQKTTMTT